MRATRTGGLSLGVVVAILEMSSARTHVRDERRDVLCEHEAVVRHLLKVSVRNSVDVPVRMEYDARAKRTRDRGYASPLTSSGVRCKPLDLHP